MGTPTCLAAAALVVWALGGCAGLDDGGTEPPEGVPATAREARLALGVAQSAVISTIDRWLVLDDDGNASPDSVIARYVLGREATSPLSEADAAPAAGWRWTEGRTVPFAVACFATFHAQRDEVRMARLAGAQLLFVNGVPFAGDPEQRGFGGVPVALRAGENELLVIGPCSNCSLELARPWNRMVVGTWDLRWSSAARDIDVEYPVFNASVVAGKFLQVHYGGGEWRDGFTTAPLGLVLAGHWVDAEREAIQVYERGDPEPDELVLDYAAMPPPAARATSAADGSVATRIAQLVEGDPSTLFLVYGTNGSSEETNALLARARLDQQLLWYQLDETPELVSDHDYLAAFHRPDWNARPAVLYGNADTNAAWSAQCPLLAHRGSLSIGGEVFRGDDLTGWCVYRADDGAARAVLADTGVRATRASVLLEPLTNTVSGRTRAIYRVKDATLECVASD